ncbi:hypothetical protein SAY86_016282 [Trapa natans]|uniref:SBP-type domain-containing protein n=1 Tax=Trapa natans TaxID=22666 RepID=A0AAN7QZR1_TRANT|nr:hypothetical protein SAY86_016282 [Trapa natans]
MDFWGCMNSLVDWDLRASPSFVTANMLTSSPPVKSGQPLLEDLELHDSPKEALGDFMLNDLCCRTNRERYANGVLSGEDDPLLKLSGSTMVNPSPRIDLKLERSVSQRSSDGPGLPRGALMVSSSESSTPMKRCRPTVFTNQAVYCQVYGCNKDLGSSKEYHRRHKVCELHSKTPKVVVSGVEQRFCQQCSRFHLLCEFDDGKRSCRKRLAGHNQRRRKPHIGFQSSGRCARFLLPCNVGKFHGVNDFIGSIKLESRTNCSHVLLNSFQPRDLHPRLPFPSPSTNKAVCPFQESNRDSSTSVCKFSNIIQHSGLSRLVDREPPAGNEEFCSIFYTESPNDGFSRILEPGCARSLLSSHSQKSPTHTSGIPMDKCSNQYSTARFLDNLVVDEGLERFLGSSEGSQVVPAVVLDGGSASFETSHEIVGESTKDPHSSEEVPTIDLLQLSSRLQKVEHERQCMKLEFNKVVQ